MYDDDECDECAKFETEEFDAESAGNTRAALDVAERWDRHRAEAHDPY